MVEVNMVTIFTDVFEDHKSNKLFDMDFFDGNTVTNRSNRHQVDNILSHLRLRDSIFTNEPQHDKN